MSCEPGCACSVFRSTLFGKDKCKTCSHAKTSHAEFRSESLTSLERTDSGSTKADGGEEGRGGDGKKDPMTPRAGGAAPKKPVVLKNPHKRVHSIPKVVFSTHRRGTSEPSQSLLDGEIIVKGCQVSGYLEKVASHTFAGKEVWQRRWFVLDKDVGTLQYWHTPSEVLLEDAKFSILMDRVISTEFDSSDKKNRTILLKFMDEKLQPFYVKAKTAPGCAHWKKEFDTTARAALLTGLTEEETCDIEVQHFENTAFAILSLAQQRTLSALFKLVLHKQHNPIFSPDIDGPHFALILSGKVSLIREGAEEEIGSTFVQHRTLKEGDYLSRATFDASLERRIATAKSAVWETHCWQLSTENYEKYLELEKDENAKKLVMMLIGEDYDFLEKVDVLSCMPKADHPFLAAFFRYQFLAAGETLFEEGSVGTALYIVLTGCVQAVGQGSVMREFREHQFFGEVGLLMAIPRTASMIASEDSVIIRLDKSDFTQATAMLTPEAREALDSLARLRLAEQFTKYDVPLFQMIPQQKYQELADICHMQDFPKNAVIFRENEPGVTFFLLVHGRCAVTVKRALADGGEIQEKIAEKKPGEYFGEIAMIVETTRTATVSCMERSVVLSITAEDFSRFFREAPEALADFELKLARHEVRLCSILYHPIGTDYLGQFLRAEYSEENLDFWKACLAFTRMPEHKSIARRKAEERRASRSSPSRSPRSPKHSNRVSASVDDRKDFITRPSNMDVGRPSNFEQRASSALLERPSAMGEISRPSVPAPSSPERASRTLDIRPSSSAAVDAQTTEPRPSSLETPPSRSGSPERKTTPPHPPSNASTKNSDGTVPGTESKALASHSKTNSTDAKTDSSTRTDSEDKSRISIAITPNGSTKSEPLTSTPRRIAESKLTFSSPISPHRKNDSGLDDLDRISLLIDLPTPPPPPIQANPSVLVYPDEIKIHERCQAIYDEFLDPKGVHQVNLSLIMREAVQNALLERRVDINTLTPCFSEVEALVQTDSFSRFKKSPLFGELLEQVQSYDSNTDLQNRMKPPKAGAKSADLEVPAVKPARPTPHRRMRSLTSKAANIELALILDVD